MHYPQRFPAGDGHANRVSFGIPILGDPLVPTCISGNVHWGVASENTSKEGAPDVHTSTATILASMRDKEREGGREEWRGREKLSRPGRAQYEPLDAPTPI